MLVSLSVQLYDFVDELYDPCLSIYLKIAFYYNILCLGLFDFWATQRFPLYTVFLCLDE